MRTTITDDKSWHTESKKNYIFKKPDYYSCVICWRSYNLNPFLYVINNNEYVFISKRGWERSHEINSPLKELGKTHQLKIKEVATEHLFISRRRKGNIEENLKGRNHGLSTKKSGKGVGYARGGISTPHVCSTL